LFTREQLAGTDRGKSGATVRRLSEKRVVVESIVWRG